MVFIKMKEYFLKLFYIMVNLRLCDCHYILKCCKNTQQLAFNLNLCASVNEDENTATSSAEFLNNIITDDAILFGYLQLCRSRILTSLDTGGLQVHDTSGDLKSMEQIYPFQFYCLDFVSLLRHDTVRSVSKRLEPRFIILLCPCSALPCIQLSCPTNIYMDLDLRLKKCQNASVLEVSTMDKKPNFHQILNTGSCDYYKNYIYLKDQKEFKANLPNVNIELTKSILGTGSQYFCVHSADVTDPIKTVGQYCKRLSKQEIHKDFQDMLYTAYFIIGAFFLGVTLIIYCLVVELRSTMYAVILMNHVACLFICFITAIINKIILLPLCTWSCILTGYLIQFSFIGATFWLNAMCLYISRSFRNINTTLKISSRTRPGHKYLFLKYSVYVWGTTLLISIITFTADHKSFLSEEKKPRIGLTKCWFEGNWALFLYFYLPTAIVLLANLLLFAFTFRKILLIQKKAKQILNKESKKHVGNKLVAKQSHRLLLCAKLFAVMGITWIFEVLSWAVGGASWYWYVTDAINALRGVFIFVICCCKKKIFLSLSTQFFSKSKNNIVSHSGKSTRSIAVCSSDAITKNASSSHQMVLFQNG